MVEYAQFKLVLCKGHLYLRMQRHKGKGMEGNGIKGQRLCLLVPTFILHAITTRPLFLLSFFISQNSNFSEKTSFGMQYQSTHLM